MADEPVAPDPKPGAGPRRRREKPDDPNLLEFTTAGRRVAKELRQKIAAMLDGDALVRAHRRRGNSIDAKDYEQAYDDIVNPIPHPVRLDLIADLCNVVGGVFMGYAINVLTNDRPDYTRLGLAGLAGIFLGGVAVALKHLKLTR